MKKSLHCFALISALVISFGIMSGPAQATTVVQFTLNNQMDGVFGPLNNYQLQLYDSQAPITVANFLRYVNNQNYNNTIVHRSVSGFIIQGGGFTPQVNAATNQFTAFNPIVSYGTITNEFSSTRSNIRGTIAMAKVGTDPNSATNQWFINIADNSSNLDYQNGGFTVFGQVVGEGMSLVDAINSTPVYPLSNYGYGGAFTDVPLYSPYTNANNLVAFPNVSVVPTVEWKGGSASSATNWGLAANWSTGSTAPSGAGVNLIFGSQAAAYNFVVMTSSSKTAGNIYFSPTTSTTILSGGNYSLTLDNSSQASKISVLGDHTIAAPVVLNNNLLVSGDGALSLTGGINGAHEIADIGGNLIFGGNSSVSGLFANKITIDAGAKITILPIAGGPLSGTMTAVPEPSALVLLCVGALSVSGYFWKKGSTFRVRGSE